MRRKKIIHVIDELKIGGAQQHLFNMLRVLSDREISDNVVVTLFRNGDIAESIRKLNIPVLCLSLFGISLRSFFSGFWEIKKLIRKNQPDIVIAHLTWSRFIALLAAWLSKVPIRIGYEHGDLFFTHWKFRWMNYLTQFFTHYLIVCSDALKKRIGEFYSIQEDKVKVIHNFVESKYFCPALKKDNRNEFKNNQTVNIFAIGSLGYGVNKRTDVIIRAVHSVIQQGGEVQLRIVGDGEQKKNLEELSGELKISSFVHFLGWRRDIADLLKEADLFCHAAPFEPFGLVCVEAMLMELPVIAPNSGGIPEIIKNNETGYLYTPLDGEELAEKILFLIKNKETRLKTGHDARKSAEQLFNAETYLKKILPLID